MRGQQFITKGISGRAKIVNAAVYYAWPQGTTFFANPFGAYLGIRPKLQELKSVVEDTPALDKLPYAEGASWDTKLGCLPGTRVALLEKVDSWIHDMDGEGILWLKGVAGSGKSAIAHTLAERLQNDSLLASSFFFDRNFPSRNTHQNLFSTISRDLARLHRNIGGAIALALKKDPALASAPLARQFDDLILEPLRQHSFVQPIVVVIDALDESIHDELDTTLLNILRNDASSLPKGFRIFITSRPTHQIERFLSDKSHITSLSIDIHSPENRRDIAAYVDAQLRDETIRLKLGSDWPDEALISALKRSAEGLFIWISTVFNYLRSAYNPRAKLGALLSKSTTHDLPADKKMDELYTSILEACGDWEDVEFQQDYDLFMGAIVAFREPLSLTALQALHAGIKDLSARTLLEHFGSVLTGLDGVHEPIRIIHQSFREFITGRASDAQRTRRFHITDTDHSARLAELCLITMNREFILPINGTGYLARRSWTRPKIPTLSGVSEQLLYCGQYWTDHIMNVHDPSRVVAHFHQFVSKHLDIWMEVTASAGRYRGFMSVLAWLQDHAQNSQNNIPGLKDTYNSDIRFPARSLLLLSERLEEDSRFEEAILAGQDSVALHRALVPESHSEFNESLAMSLKSLAIQLDRAGLREEARKNMEEALGLHRALADVVLKQPKAFAASTLASMLEQQSKYLSFLDLRKEALSTIQEALRLNRLLHAEQPSVNTTSALANSLWTLATCECCSSSEALVAIQESINLTRALTLEDPGYSKIKLAERLYQSSYMLFDSDRLEEALKNNQEAVVLYRALAAEKPTVWRKSSLSIALGEQAAILERLDSQATNTAPLAIHEEVVQLSREIAKEQPANEKFSRDLALSLKYQAESLQNHNRYDEALLAIQEALALYQDYYDKFGADVDIVINQIPQCTDIEGWLIRLISRNHTMPTETPSSEIRVLFEWERCYECL
ncbi:hypothetical protein HWV62_12701 [Athelia sp. TMB]|nr:hypothetical protein HWV62_12701 [Athelia sp. TMB]